MWDLSERKKIRIVNGSHLQISQIKLILRRMLKGLASTLIH